MTEPKGDLRGQARMAMHYTARNFLDDVFALGVFDVTDGERLVEQLLDRVHWQDGPHR